MKPSQLYDVVCIGNYTKDTIISPAGTRYVDGGGSRYAAYAASRLGTKVAIVTHLAQEDAHIVADLVKSGIDCYHIFTPHSTLMQLEYPTTNPDIRNLTVSATAGAITCGEILDLEMKSAVIGSSLRGEVQLDLIQAVKRKGVTLAADVQGYIRVLHGKELRNEPWPEMQATLAQVDILKSDAREAEFLTGESDIFKAARKFESLGPGEIVLTHKDGILILAEGRFHDLAFHPGNLSGRSGRGDTCIGTYVAMRLTKTPLEAGIWAAAVTSLKMEKLGPFDRSIRDVENLIRDKYNHGSI
jgi:sugar/nucleoside kinase (ribokinase family)